MSRKVSRARQGKITEWIVSGGVFVFGADSQALTPCECSRASLEEERLLFFPGKDSSNEKP